MHPRAFLFFILFGSDNAIIMLVSPSLMGDDSISTPALKGRLKRSVNMLFLPIKTGQGVGVVRAHRKSLSVHASLEMCTNS